jgi:hypothetical protein
LAGYGVFHFVKGFAIFGKDIAHDAPGGAQAAKREEAQTRAVKNKKMQGMRYFQNLHANFSASEF